MPLSDEHMSEYVGAYAQRLAWLTGFGGSAGTAVVLADETREPAAAIFVDGRYTLQVRDQVDGRLYAYESVPRNQRRRMARRTCAREARRSAIDPWLHGKRLGQDGAKTLLKPRGAELVAVESNPIDAIWAGPPRALGRARAGP